MFCLFFSKAQVKLNLKKSSTSQASSFHFCDLGRLHSSGNTVGLEPTSPCYIFSKTQVPWIIWLCISVHRIVSQPFWAHIIHLFNLRYTSPCLRFIPFITWGNLISTKALFNCKYILHVYKLSVYIHWINDAQCILNEKKLFSHLKGNLRWKSLLTYLQFLKDLWRCLK